MSYPQPSTAEVAANEVSITETIQHVLMDMLGISPGSPRIDPDLDMDDEDFRNTPDHVGVRPSTVWLSYDGQDFSYRCEEFYIMMGIIMVFLFAVYMERRHTKYRIWEIMEMFGMFKAGLGFYFFSRRIFDIIVIGQFDPIHDLLMKANGAVLMALSLNRMRYFVICKQTRSSLSSYTFSRVLGGTILLITLATHQFNANLQDYKHKLSNAHMAIIVLGCSLWLLGNIMVATNISSFGHYCISVPMRKSHMVDLLFCIHAVFWLFGYSEYVLKRVLSHEFRADGMHVHLLRTFACLLSINMFHGIGSIRFHQKLDKQGYLFCNLLMYTFTLPLVLVFIRQLAFNSGIFGWLSILGTVAVLNCIYGFLNPSCKDFRADLEDMKNN